MAGAGFGQLNAALGLRWRETAVLSNFVLYFLLLFAGVNVPLDLLPGWLQSLSQVLPVTHGVEAAREIVAAQTVERTLRAGHELPTPEPALTSKQSMSIEIYAERQADPKEREDLLSLARGSALSNFDSLSHTDSPEPHAAREVAPVIERGR